MLIATGSFVSIFTWSSNYSEDFTYSWSNEQTTENISDLFAGDYTVIINQNNECKNGTLVFLDSPNTTNEITYKIQCTNQGASTVFVNRSSLFQDSANSGVLASSITVMEVSAWA